MKTKCSLQGSVLAVVLCAVAVGCDDDEGPGGGLLDGGGLNPDGGDGLIPDGGAPGAEVGVPSVAVNCSALVIGAQVTGGIDTNQIWQGVIAVTGEVTVRAGAKITIMPGTIFVMSPDTSIDFGWNSNIVTVMAQGTAAQPIRFCGKMAMPGYWRNVEFGSKTTSDSVFEHVIISDGGGDQKAALVVGAKVLVKDVTVQNSGHDGVSADDFQAGSARLSVTGAAKVPAALTGQGAITNFPVGGSFTGNIENVVALRFETIDANTTFHALPIPYRQELDMATRVGAVTIFEPGIVYHLVTDVGLEFGWNSNIATVKMNGTAEKPIVFDRTGPAAGYFSHIIVGLKVTSDSIMKHVKIGGGGEGTEAALQIEAPITVDNVTLDGNKTAGLMLEGTGLSAMSTTLTINNTQGAAAMVEPNNMITLPKGGTFTGNTKSYIEVKGGAYTASGKVPSLGIPFRIASKITTWTDSKLTIEAGTQFIMAPDSELDIGWNSNAASFIAEGTAAMPIVFRGADDVAGYWGGIVIGRQVLSDSKMNYVNIVNGGKAGGGGVRLGKPFTIQNCKISKSAGFGIEKQASDVTDYAAAGNTFEMNAQGNVGS